MNETEGDPRYWKVVVRFLCVYRKEIKIELDSSNICGVQVEYKQLFSVLQETSPLSVGSHTGPWKGEQVVKMVSKTGWDGVRFYP